MNSSIVLCMLEIAGEAGLGKSQLSIAMAASVTTGGEWPCREGRAPQGGVVILSAEDGAADTVVPRLNAVGVPAALVKDILDRASALQQQLTASGQVTPELQRSEAAALTESVVTLLTIGDTAGALTAADRARQILESLLATNPSNTNWQRHLSVSYENIGNVLEAAGQREEAFAAYQKSLAIRQKLADSDPGNAGWQNDLRSSIGSIGNLAYGLVLARNFASALEAADQAICLAPDLIWLYDNRAHALMFLGRVDEARALYLKYRGEKDVYRGEKDMNEKSWETAVLEDFAELRKAGLTHPLMDEIEKRFAAGG
jgi:tetratricopeptide (TPR) repeat protein